MRGYALGGAIAVFAERFRKPPHPNPLPHLHGGEGALQLRLRANQVHELLAPSALSQIFRIAPMMEDRNHKKLISAHPENERKRKLAKKDAPTRASDLCKCSWTAGC